jgi:translation initiation factor 1
MKKPPESREPLIRLRMERRRGKPVTIAAASGLPPAELAALARELKSLCAAGGTLKSGEIEVQGEHRDRLRLLLHGRGYRVKG